MMKQISFCPIVQGWKEGAYMHEDAQVTTACWPSWKRNKGPGNLPLYVIVETIRLGAISIGLVAICKT